MSHFNPKFNKETYLNTPNGIGKTPRDYSKLGAASTVKQQRSQQLARFQVILKYLITNEGQWFHLNQIIDGTNLKLNKTTVGDMLSGKKFPKLYESIPSDYQLEKDYRLDPDTEKVRVYYRIVKYDKT